MRDHDDYDSPPEYRGSSSPPPVPSMSHPNVGKGKGKEKKRGLLGQLKDKAIGTKEERREAKRLREQEVSFVHKTATHVLRTMSYSDGNALPSNGSMLRDLGHPLKCIRDRINSISSTSNILMAGCNRRWDINKAMVSRCMLSNNLVVDSEVEAQRSPCLVAWQAVYYLAISSEEGSEVTGEILEEGSKRLSESTGLALPHECLQFTHQPMYGSYPFSFYEQYGLG